MLALASRAELTFELHSSGKIDTTRLTWNSNNRYTRESNPRYLTKLPNRANKTGQAALSSRSTPESPASTCIEIAEIPPRANALITGNKQILLAKLLRFFLGTNRPYKSLVEAIPIYRWLRFFLA